MNEVLVNTPLGIAKIVGSKNGISSISVLDADCKLSNVVPEELMECVTQLDEYFNDKRTQFSLQLDLNGTDFQKKVWRELQKIPYGKTISYLDLAKQLGDVKAIRAIANANGKNPIWIVIPCHRVIGSDGALTGYAGGLHRKKWLLEHENPLKQLSLF